MPGGGTLTVRTTNCHVDADYASVRVDLEPGEYVELDVTDTGEGMSPDVIRRAFEPFFSTKDVGKGTGLGLATVYGIVKQAGGDARLYSEPGLGTTVKVYLPLVSDAPAAGGPAEAPEGTASGVGRTVLLVEDESSVRTVTARILAGHGYRVLQASGPLEALALGSQHRDEVDLLLTDVVMPRMTGTELAAALSGEQPGVKVLFMTGHTEDALVQDRLVDGDVELIQKPFTSESLLGHVRRLLGPPKATA
jgi:CheY-like chemotaxis protein